MRRTGYMNSSPLPISRITHLERDFDVMTARFKCDACATKYKSAKHAAELVGLAITRSDIDVDPYTFLAMGGIPTRVCNFRMGAVVLSLHSSLTARGGVSNTLVDMMWPLFVQRGCEAGDVLKDGARDADEDARTTPPRV